MPDSDKLHVVTGAYGYTGKYVAQRLLAAGHRVRTLTNSLRRTNPFGGAVEAFPLAFGDPARLTEALRGATVLYNTYWVRFPMHGVGYEDAVRNTLTLFAAAREAGVGRIVHVSIMNPSLDSPFGYFRGKAEIEAWLRTSGVPHSILRPAVLFGHEDILVNNIAWALRRFPLFPVFGDGRYRLQPIYVEDFADLLVAAGQSSEDETIGAIGPETFTFRGLAEAIGRIIGHPRPTIGVPPSLAYVGVSLIGRLQGDVMLTWDEVGGLMADLLYVDAPPAGTTRLTDWAQQHADTLGRRYASELARRNRRDAAYEDLAAHR